VGCIYCTVFATTAGCIYCTVSAATAAAYTVQYELLVWAAYTVQYELLVWAAYTVQYELLLQLHILYCINPYCKWVLYVTVGTKTLHLCLPACIH